MSNKIGSRSPPCFLSILRWCKSHKKEEDHGDATDDDDDNGYDFQEISTPDPDPSLQITTSDLANTAAAVAATVAAAAATVAAAAASASSKYIDTIRPFPIEFGYEELDAMTDGFKVFVGKGGFGSVTKGLFTHGTREVEVAVKRVVAEDGNEVEEAQFTREITTISSLQHFNLSHFLGYCYVPQRHRFLVYEYMCNSSLDRWIFCDDMNKCLRWDLRYQVAIDVAKALKYLHHDCLDKVLHLDVKPENVLLDGDFHAHLSDFGLSRLMGRDERMLKTRGGGTLAYMAPEYLLLENRVSEKSDVYSYGMMLLELVHGERNVPHHTLDECRGAPRRSSYPKTVREKVREGKIMDVVDRRLFKVDKVNTHEIDVVVSTALWCIQEKYEERPSMENVVEMLEQREVRPIPPETRMLMMELLLNGPEALGDVPFTGDTEQPQYSLHTISTISWLAHRRLMFPKGENINMSFQGSDAELNNRTQLKIQDLAWIPRKFEYEELVAATDGFKTPLREDGLSTLFLGRLEGGDKQIMVKWFKGDKQWMKESFQSKMSRIAGLQHLNLLRILGYSIHTDGIRDSEDHFLVYDFPTNGSLDLWIYEGDRDSSKCLSWALRCQAAVDLAKAMAYLHHDHHNLKICALSFRAENVWLDENFRVRFTGYDSSYKPRNLLRFEGWDVSRYGKLLMELVTGKRMRDLIKRVPHIRNYQKKEGDMIMELLDRRLLCDNGGFDSEQLVLLMKVALLCSQAHFGDKKQSMTFGMVLGMLAKLSSSSPSMECYDMKFSAADIPHLDAIADGDDEDGDMIDE